MTSSDAQTRAEALIGTSLAGAYRLETLLDESDAGASFGARARERAVFVKILYPESLRGEAGERFRRESGQWQGLRHPHALEILAAGTDDASGLSYVVSSAPSGRNLEQVLSERGALDPVAAARVGLQAAQAVEAAHRLGLLHRGIRPDNIVLEPVQGQELFVKVRNFGTTRPAPATGAPAADAPQELLEPPDYAAPEQLRNAETIDERADVWALGATVYTMLCGSPPFGHLEEVADVVTAILTDEAPHLQDRAPWIDPELTRVVHRALAHSPNARFATCEEFAKALRPFAGGEERLLESSLRTVAPEVRSRHAERADLSFEPAPRSVLETEGDDLAIVGRKLDGKYEVRRLLGRGGMGAVYEVKGPGGEKLAAKVISRGVAGEHPAALMRFAREAKAASAVVSPNVCRTLDAGTDEELALPYIIMEHLNGTDLSKVMKSNGALDPQVAVRLALQGASGIAAAHARHVVHRDIKPANLFLDVDPTSREVLVKVCDFGVAKRKRTEDGQSKHSHYSLTRTGGMIGSPMYMAPEQARNAKSVDERADVWSLSVVLWEALSGLRLWGNQTSLGELIVAICTEPIQRLEEVAPWVPKDLARIVHWGLERDLNQRTPNLHAFMAGLELFCGGSHRVNFEQLAGLDDARKAELTRRNRAAEGRQSSLSPPGRRSSLPAHAVVASSGARSSLGWLVALVVVVALGAGAALVFLRH